MDAAAGLLIIPRMHASGDVLGVAYGRGVMREAAGRHTYYNVVVGPTAAYAGLDGKAVFLIFLSKDSLFNFRSGLIWADGLNGTLAVTSNPAALHRANEPPDHIPTLILTPRGLVNGLSLKGGQFIKVPVYMCALSTDAPCP
ncbi:hypothetical protein CEY04_08960 [Achromobacter sp. HZ28]|nr:hypothetical protein CEY05_19040 [Achromobacter sp. HZ34]OWT79148.1 hypothetical protein CEY04_08960 [Achromobacter sp. HZ28]